MITDLTHGVPIAAGSLVLVATASAGSAALFALTAFWPRRFQVIDPARVRDDALGRMPDALTQVAILDTNVEAIQANRAFLGSKVLRLKIGLSLLFVAVVALGTGTVVERVGGIS